MEYRGLKPLLLSSKSTSDKQSRYINGCDKLCHDCFIRILSINLDCFIGVYWGIIPVQLVFGNLWNFPRTVPVYNFFFHCCNRYRQLWCIINSPDHIASRTRVPGCHHTIDTMKLLYNYSLLIVYKYLIFTKSLISSSCTPRIS